MSKQKNLDYAGMVEAIQAELPSKEIAELYGCSLGTVYTVRGIVKQLGKIAVKDSKPSLDSFTPRQLMEELAGRGFSGKLSVLQTIDITNF